MKTHFALIPVAFAKTNANPCTSLGDFSTLCSLTSDDFGFVVSTGINLILIFAVIIAVLFFMFGGVKWIFSRGDKEKVEGARNHIIASLVGLIMVFLAFFAINLLVGFFFPGKSLKDLSLPTLGPDTKPPTVSVSSPVSDSTILGTTAIQVSASDNRQVTKVEFYVDGLLKNTDTTDPFEYSWDAKSYQHNSSHDIKVLAYDSAGNVGTSQSINVVVIDVTKPTVNITNPISGERVTSKSTVTLSALVSDVSPITQVEFRVNGALKCTDTSSPYVCVWQVPTTKGVVYRLEASALDTAGNAGTGSNSVTAM